MKALIYRPASNAMQSGKAKKRWKLKTLPQAPLYVEPLMGWTGMTDTTQEVTLYFNSEQAAVDYAKHNGLEYEIAETEARVIKPKSYAANFATNRIE
jgi:uncharacterized protein YcnI